MKHVVITAGCRTPIGTIGGQFKTLTSLDLSIPVMQALVERSGIDAAGIDDVIWGCNYQRTYKERRDCLLQFRALRFTATAHRRSPPFKWVTTRLWQAKQSVLWPEAQIP